MRNNNIRNKLENPKQMNLLLVTLGVMFGVLVLIIGYYIIASGSSTPNNIAVYQRPLNNNTNTNTDNNMYRPKDPMTALKQTDLPKITEAPIGYKKIGEGKKQVFHVSNNIYTYDDAEPLCKSLGAELSTYEQLKDAYKDGADWCSYGWTKGQMALYPTQYKTFLKMQENEPGKREQCGMTGINGGYFENKHRQFGVNCYGIKSSPLGHEKTKHVIRSDKEIEQAIKIAEFRRKRNNISIAPFNQEKWSNCSNN